MKKIHILWTAIFAILIFINGCSDSEFEKRFEDPEKTSTVTVEKLMTGAFEKGNLFTMPWYIRYFSFEIPQMGNYAQVMGYINDPGVYQLNVGGCNERWINFYKILAQYRLLESTLEQMPESQKEDYKIFMILTRIYVYDHLHQLVDAFGDVPFTKAGKIALIGKLEESKPEYDRAEDLYKLMLTDLKDINAYLAVYKPSTIVNTLLKDQDYINKGKIDVWRKYANSLRLRIASRAASNGPLVDEARSAIVEILNNPETFPIVMNNNENIQINHQGPKLTAVEEQHEKGIRGGFESWNGQMNRASKTYLEVLAGDPRLDVIYDKNAEGEYIGIDPLMIASEQQKLFDRPKDQGGNYFSAVDTATFSRNNKFPGIIITASEMDFIRAEAIQKFGVSGSAEEAFKKGVKNSVEFYYNLNSLGDYRDPLPKPSAEELDAFVDKKWNEYNNKEEGIAVQRWIHHGMVQMSQAWHEYRKTGFPVLAFKSDAGGIDVQTPPTRLRYPTSERNSNQVNYQKVQDKDGYYNKIFWAK